MGPESATTTPGNHPIGFRFFFWGEFAERCSYYGMRTLLPLYMTSQLKFDEADTTLLMTIFKFSCYLLPLLGGYLADRYFGKYWTIVGFSVPYVIGQLLIGFPNQTLVMFALLLLACGSGVIKPNISALMGQTYDQQRPGNITLRANAFLWFYFAVNVGSTISMLFLPIVRNHFGYQVAFLIPAILMAVALFVFAAGKKHYATETIGPPPPSTAEEKVKQKQVLAGLFGIFFLMIFFWVTYEHNDNLWVYFARDHIDRRMPTWVPWIGGVRLAADQFLFINAALILIFVPISQWFWPKVDPTGTRFPHTTKMMIGFLFTAAAPACLAIAASGTMDGSSGATMKTGFAIQSGADQFKLASTMAPDQTTAIAMEASAAWMNAAADEVMDPVRVSMLWIILAFFVLTIGEVLVYGTGLDLSYGFAPKSMKGFVTACFLLTNALGNSINMIYGPMYQVKQSGFIPPATYFAIDAGIVFAAAIAFYFVGKRFNRVHGRMSTEG